MNRKMFRRGAAIVAFAFLSSIAAAALGSGDGRKEIGRLADLTQWKPGITVADIGAGDGTYSFAAAQKVGPSGHVYAIEIDQEKLKALRSEVTKRKLENVTVMEDTADDTKLPSNCCDVIFLRHVYHHLTQPGEFDASLVRSLKPQGYLAIIDFPPSAGSSLPEGVPKNRGGHGIPEKVVEEELTNAGLKVEKTIDDWSGQDYCIILVKQK